MAKDNGFCGVGIAYQSSITGENCLIPVSTLAEISTHPIDPKYKLLYTPPYKYKSRGKLCCLHSSIDWNLVLDQTQPHQWLYTLGAILSLWEYNVTGSNIPQLIPWSTFPGLTPPRMELKMFRAFPVNWTSLNANVQLAPTLSSNSCPDGWLNSRSRLQCYFQAHLVVQKFGTWGVVALFITMHNIMHALV